MTTNPSESQILFDFARSIFTKWKFWVGIILGASLWIFSSAFKVDSPYWLKYGVWGLALLFACFETYRKQEKEIRALRDALETKRADIVIYSSKGTRSIVLINRATKAEVGTYIELGLTIENKGSRQSNINEYVLEFQEAKRRFPDCKPKLGWSLVPGSSADYSINREGMITNDEFISVLAEGRAGPGILPFYLDGFVIERGNPSHVKLSMTDTNGSSGSQTFELHPE